MSARGSWRKHSLCWLVPLGFLALYGSAYVTLRASRELIRTGMFYNCRRPSGALHPDAGWMHSGVRRRDGSGLGAWVEVAFSPLIFAESSYWDTIGRQQGTEAVDRP